MLLEINKPNPIPLLKVEPVVSFIFTITSPPLPVFFLFFSSVVTLYQGSCHISSSYNYQVNKPCGYR
jgi:hypothetical protein